MAKLVAAKCPNCGANLRIDPGAEVATCSYCNASALVQSEARRLGDDAARQNPRIPAERSSKPGWVVAVVAVMVLAAASTAALLLARPSGSDATLQPAPSSATPPPAIEPLASPTASSPEHVAAAEPPAVPPAHGKGPKLSEVSTVVNGRLDATLIRRLLGQHFARFRMCYERGLMRTPKLSGQVRIRFVIGRDGSVSNVANDGSDLPDGDVVACISQSFAGMQFPVPPGGIVTVGYVLALAP